MKLTIKIVICYFTTHEHFCGGYIEIIYDF